MNRDEIIDFDQLFESGLKCRRGVSWKPSVKYFILNDVEECYKMSEKLSAGKWENSKPKPIHIAYPKPREGLSIPFRDRVYQRSINDNCLYPVTTRSFVLDNCACQRRKGTDFARKRLKQHIWNHFCKYGNSGYVLQIDVKSYYPSMDHSVVFDVFSEYLDTDIHKMVCDVLMDQYTGDVGFCPGSQMVQIAGITVPNIVDHHIKEVIHAKHYIRYMDDFWLLLPTIGEAEAARNSISLELSKLKLRTHPDKTTIRKLSDGFEFLGFEYTVTSSGKILMSLKSENVRHERRKLRRLVNLAKAGEIPREKPSECLGAWFAHAMEGDSHNLLIRTDSYFQNLWEE